jgi:hypothetical protein
MRPIPQALHCVHLVLFLTSPQLQDRMLRLSLFLPLFSFLFHLVESTPILFLPAERRLRFCGLHCQFKFTAVSPATSHELPE